VKGEQERQEEWSRRKQIVVEELKKKARELKFEIREEDMELYADLTFRAFEKQPPSEVTVKMGQIPQMNYFIKEYMELCAEVTHSQMIKYEA
jgi:hypothetical protein